MSNSVSISICIPAYKRVEFLQRLFNSIAEQTFKSFEVILSDDSADAQVAELAGKFADKFRIVYLKNTAALGTPENWNHAIRHAKGEWIKLMHDDDWFRTPDSLSKFFALTTTSSQASFVFSGSVMIDGGREIGVQALSDLQLKFLTKDPANLFAKNVIGPPSVIMHRNDQKLWYDNRMKWLVDVDFYIRAIRHFKTFEYTKEPLVNVGFSEVQVTKAVFHDREVVIPETLLMLSKLDLKILDRIRNYDFAWRLMRNYHITSIDDLKRLKPSDTNISVPDVFDGILRFQRFIPRKLLQVGVFSKGFMFMNYIARKIQNR